MRTRVHPSLSMQPSPPPNAAQDPAHANPSEPLAGHDLAEALQSQGLHREAAGVLEPLVSELRQSLGEDHPDTLAALSDLSTSLLHSDRKTRGLALAEKVFDTRQAVLGETHPSTVDALNNFAMALLLNGHFQRARLMQERALWLRVSRVPSDDPSVLGAMVNIAAIAREQGEQERADGLLNTVQTWAEESLERIAEDSPADPQNNAETTAQLRDLAASAMYNRAIARVDREDSGDAEHLLKRAVAIRMDVLGGGNVKTVNASEALANFYAQRGRLNEAQEVTGALADALVEDLGPDHLQTLEVRMRQALMLADLGEFTQAEGMIESVLIKLQALPGDPHPAIEDLERVLDKMRRDNPERSASLGFLPWLVILVAAGIFGLILALYAQN